MAVANSIRWQDFGLEMASGSGKLHALARFCVSDVGKILGWRRWQDVGSVTLTRFCVSDVGKILGWRFR